MTWAKFDDAFWTHPKTLAAGNEAVGAFVRLVCYGCNQLTDGFVPMKVARFVAGPAVLRRLVDVGLLEPQSTTQPTTQPTGYLIHDFLVYQPSRESVEKDREGIRARVAKHRETKAKHESCNGVTNALVTPDVTAGVTPVVTAPRPVPSRPVPKSEKTEEGDARGVTPVEARSSDPASPPGVPPSAVHPVPEATRRPKGARKPPAPTPDTIPLPGTAARGIYEALLADSALRPIVGNPGDFAARVSDPDAYPGVNVLAEVKRAGEYAAANPGKHSDGRAYLRNWLSRKAGDVARAPKPASGPAQRPAVSIVRAPDPVVTPEEHARRVAGYRATREAIAAEAAARKEASR